jgi:hypothetical protein
MHHLKCPSTDSLHCGFTLLVNKDRPEEVEMEGRLWLVTLYILYLVERDCAYLLQLLYGIYRIRTRECKASIGQQNVLPIIILGRIKIPMEPLVTEYYMNDLYAKLEAVLGPLSPFHRLWLGRKINSNGMGGFSISTPSTYVDILHSERSSRSTK